MNMKSTFLSVIIPAYNEEAVIKSTLEEVAEYLSANAFESETIVVDDGSKDATRDIARSCEGLFRDLRVLENPGNAGKGAAVRKGVLEARGEYILFMDADNSTSIRELEKFPYRDNGTPDICIGSRRVPGAAVTMPARRNILGKVFIALARLVLGIRVRDINCGFKLFKREAAMDIFSRLTSNGWSFDTEVLFIARKRSHSVREIPVHWTYKGDSKVRPVRDGIISFLSLVSIAFNSLSGKYR